jgi:hypothetical protein
MMSKESIATFAFIAAFMMAPANAQVAGDLDGDADVDRIDQRIFQGSLGQCTGDAGFVAETDYNSNGCTDLDDYRTWVGFYKAFTPPPPCEDRTRSARSLFNTPRAPTLTISFGLKQLHFDWTAASGATHYKLFEDPDGVSGYTQVGADLPLCPPSVTLDIAVHRTNWANARYLVEACKATACTPSNEVFALSGMLQTIGYFKASNSEAGDWFGGSVALSADGNTVAVGASNEDQPAPDVGAVYVFARPGGTWSQEAYLKASTMQLDDLFGWSVALSADGNTLAATAFGEDSAATGVNGDQSDNSADAAGAVYVFARSGSTWSQQAYIKASNTGAGDSFGGVSNRSLALSADGNTLAVGAPNEDSAATGIDGNQADNSATNAGAVYVFARSGSTWLQQAYVKASNTHLNTPQGDRFGTSVALSADGNTLAVGARGEESAATGIDGNQADNSAENAGAVYVFARSGSTWSQQAYIKASNTQEFDDFYSVALSADGNTLAVGASGEDSAATGIDGNQADNSAFSAGAVYVFARSGSTWSQQAYIKASNTEGSDGFGSVALSADGNTLAVAATLEDGGVTGIDGNQADNSAASAGAVYLYTRSGATWSQQAYVKASNTGAIDNFGGSVALSTDGNTLAVGVRNEDSAATGIGGDQANNSATNSGAVYLY